MSNVLKVVVPITLSRDNDGYWLHADFPNGDSAMIALHAQESPLVRRVFTDWATNQLVTAYVNKRRKTGTKDATGQDIHEGDIITRQYNEHYGIVTGAIKWDRDKAAFVAEGAFTDGGGWKTLNLERAEQLTVIGNIFFTPELLQPAEKLNA